VQLGRSGLRPDTKPTCHQLGPAESRKLIAPVGPEAQPTQTRYDRDMRRIDVHLKVELDLDENESPERRGAEIVRVIRKIYGVRQADVSSIVERET
jgi:hypothetical protein